MKTMKRIGVAFNGTRAGTLASFGNVEFGAVSANKPTMGFPSPA